MHTCVICLKATEVYPPMFVALAKRMRIKSRGSNQAAHSFTHTHTCMSVSRHVALAETLHHISPEIFWRHIIVSLQHTHQSQPDLHTHSHHSASCLCACLNVCMCVVVKKRSEDRRVRAVCMCRNWLIAYSSLCFVVLNTSTQRT